MKQVFALLFCFLLISSAYCETYTLSSIEVILCSVLNFCDILSVIVGSLGGTSPGPNDDIVLSASTAIGLSISSSLNVNSITFSSASGSVLNISSAAIVAIGATFTLASGQAVNVLGNVSVAGKTAIQSASTFYVVSGAVVAFNGGIDIDANAGAGQGLQLSSGGQVSISADSTINGTISLAQNSIFVIKNGVVTSANAVTAYGNTTVQTSWKFLQSGYYYTQAQGFLFLNSATTAVIWANVAINQNSYLIGNGNVTGNLNVEGTIAVGNSPGTVYVNGDLVMSSTATFSLDIQSSSSFDRTIVSGSTSVNGILQCHLLNSYVPNNGQSFTFITSAGEVSGKFNIVEGDTIDDFYKFHQTENTYTVVATYGSATSLTASGLLIFSAIALAVL